MFHNAGLRIGKAVAVTSFLIFAFTGRHLYGKNMNASLAVLPLRSVNCGDAVAKRATDMIRNSIQGDSVNSVLSKAETMKGLAQFPHADPACQDIPCIERFSTYVNAHKILVGTITWTDENAIGKSGGRYSIKCSIIILNPWEFEERYYELTEAKEPEIAKVIRQVEAALTDNKISKIKFSLSVRLGSLFPTGRLSRKITYGLGGEFSFDIIPFSILNKQVMGISAALGFDYCPGDSGSLRYLMMIPLTVGVFFPVYLPKSFILKPLIATGLMTSVLSRDTNRVPGNPARYRTENYYDAMMRIGIGAQYRINHLLSVELFPALDMVFASGGPAILIGLRVGCVFQL